MNPIYKFQLSAGAATQRAFPIYKDDLAKDFEKESNQEFFRAKLSGKLTFESDDYTFIASRAFDTQFVLEIFISYNAGQSWTSYWRGTFWKTDCEFDADAETVVVQPTVWDQYNDVLAGLDKEYNLIELAPEIVPVKVDKRPMIQVYVPGQSVIGCFLSGMWWEQEAEPESDETKLKNDFHFSLNKTLAIGEISGSMSPALHGAFTKTYTGDSRFNPREIGTQEFAGDGYKLVYFFTSGSGGSQYSWTIIRLSDNVTLWNYSANNQVPPELPYTFTLTPVPNSGATGNVVLYVHNIPVYSRFVLDAPQISGLQTYPIPANDIVENNRNYTRVIGYYFPDTIYFSTSLTSTPNQWGLYQPGQYYQPPYLYWNPELFPVARNAWGRVSIWFTFSSFDWLVEESGRQTFSIRHAYPISSVISVLLAKIAPRITHAGTTDYSQFLYGTNPLLGINQHIFITPKSNIISLGYDQPAQKAPVTLKRILDMLRDCFRCYWFVDDQSRFRIEHIEFFRCGGTYTGTPVVGRDLTVEQVARSGKKWAFDTSQFEYDKPEMAARYQFGWMDDVTQLFDGNPIDIVSKYVNPDNIEQIEISQFTSDVDYILLNPGEISKDGFVLLAAVPDDTVFNKYLNASGNEVDDDSWNISPFIPVSGGASIEWFTGANSSIGYLIEYDSNKQYLDYWTPYVDSARTAQLSANSAFVRISYANTNYLAYANVNGSNVFSASDAKLKLPYINFELNSAEHILQNAYVAFIYLQQYYFWDMPARYFKYNGEQMAAQGIKRLKTQKLKFPSFNDPNTLQLIKTNLGNGTIQKMSVNLSNRNADATLKYDTE